MFLCCQNKYNNAKSQIRSCHKTQLGSSPNYYLKKCKSKGPNALTQSYHSSKKHVFVVKRKEMPEKALHALFWSITKYKYFSPPRWEWSFCVFGSSVLLLVINEIQLYQKKSTTDFPKVLIYLFVSAYYLILLWLYWALSFEINFHGH